MIELAMVLPIVIAVIFSGIDAIWATFQVQELRDAANAAVRATISNKPSDIVGGCASSQALGVIRQAAELIPISASDTLCIPPPGTATNVLFLQDGALKICIIADPTVYSPSHVTAVVSDTLASLAPISLFNVPVTATSESTTGSAGVPGTATESPPTSCP